MNPKQINNNQYFCPICNGELSVEGTDLTIVVDDKDTRTDWKCDLCQERFFSLEKSYVYPPEKAPPFDCLFCHQRAEYLSLNNDWSDYWRCEKCGSTFEQSFVRDWEGIDTINIYTTIGPRKYVLRQFLREKESRIDLLPNNPDDTMIVVATFNFLMPLVTPTNIQNKLKTYILFS